MGRQIENYFHPSIFHWFNMMVEGIVLLDENINVIFANDAYLHFTGLQKEDIIGHYMPQIRPGAVSPEVYRTKSAQYNRYRNVNGTETYADVIPYLDGERVVGALVVLRDMKVINDLFKVINENKNLITQLNERLGDLFRTIYTPQNIIGFDADYWRTAETAAQTNSSVLLVGESGTGKEVMAQMIHNQSPRSGRHFVDINCAALPEQLLESELFGYAPGAFTGANKNGKIGLFELANHGTLFLDEITEMPLGLQSKLLRVLQERIVRRVGDNKNIPLDVRIIAATNQRVEDALANNQLRSDLYYRLAVFEIELPPLRQRRQDILEYIDFFLREESKKKHISFGFAENVKEILFSYHWPGNFRQLKNALEYMCEVASDGCITRKSLPKYVMGQNQSTEEASLEKIRLEGGTLMEMLGCMEREILKNSIEKFGNDVNGKRQAAISLGISIATLYNKLKRYHLLDNR